jgi:hypothetical protein
VNKILEKVDVRGYDSPVVELEDQLARSAERKFIQTDFLLFAPYNKRERSVRELSESGADAGGTDW